MGNSITEPLTEGMVNTGVAAATGDDWEDAATEGLINTAVSGAFGYGFGDGDI